MHQYKFVFLSLGYFTQDYKSTILLILCIYLNAYFFLKLCFCESPLICISIINNNIKSVLLIYFSSQIRLSSHPPTPLSWH